jgi:hypothetical protein
MIRFVNLNVAFIALTITIAFGNYRVKEAAVATAKRLAEVDAAIGEQDVALRTLDAEWSYLNDPARLQELALRHLHLAQIKPSQVMAVGEMPERLPLEAGVRHAQEPPALPGAPSKRAAPKREPSPAFVTPARADDLAPLSPQH